MHQSICAQPNLVPPRLLRGICPPCHSRGWDICKSCAARGPGIWQSRGQPRAFDTQALSYRNIHYTEDFTGKKKKQIGSFVKDGKKLKRFVKACSRLFACISSLLITPELDCEHGSEAIDANQRFFGYWIKFLLILFEEHTFIFARAGISPRRRNPEEAL